MDNRNRSAFRRFAVDSSLTAILFSLAVIIAACSSVGPAEGTSVTLSNGETAGVIVTMDPDESTTAAPPSESVSGTASSGDDVIAAPTVPKSGSPYAFRYQNILIMPGSEEDRTILRVSLIAVALSCLFWYVPVLKEHVSTGFAIIICAVVAALIGVFSGDHGKKEGEAHG